jgi:hypothetical protein
MASTKMTTGRAITLARAASIGIDHWTQEALKLSNLRKRTRAQQRVLNALNKDIDDANAGLTVLIVRYHRVVNAPPPAL